MAKRYFEDLSACTRVIVDAQGRLMQKIGLSNWQVRQLEQICLSVRLKNSIAVL